MDDLISRADALRELNGACSNWEDDAKVAEIIHALPSAEAVQGWIPCSERLPDNKTYVLTTIQVSGRQPHARSGFYHDGFFHNDNGDTWKATDREVRAWMPLPNPYKGGDSE